MTPLWCKGPNLGQPVSYHRVEAAKSQELLQEQNNWFLVFGN